MKYVRLTVTPDPAVTPRLFEVLSSSPHADSVSVTDWNVVPDGAADGPSVTMLYEVRGDREQFAAELRDTPGVRRVDTAPLDTSAFTVLVVLEPHDVSLFPGVLATVTRTGLVPVTPIVYRDGGGTIRLVGPAAVLQRAVDAFPRDLTVDVNAVGDYERSHERPTAKLSDRQREAVLAARDLGYYDRPRSATHADIAERLGCAPNTASEHLQKAETKLIRDALRFEN